MEEYDFTSQFNGECIYATPDPEKTYRLPTHYGIRATTDVTKLPLLVKWILLAEKYPKLIQKIKDMIRKEKEDIEKIKQIAYASGNVELIEYVDKYVKCVDRSIYSDRNPLLIAIYMDNSASLEIMKILIDAGCKTKMYMLKNTISNKPKYIKEMLKLLVYAEYNTEPEHFITPLEIAIKILSKDAVEILLEAGYSRKIRLCKIMEYGITDSNKKRFELAKHFDLLDEDNIIDAYRYVWHDLEEINVTENTFLKYIKLAITTKNCQLLDKLNRLNIDNSAEMTANVVLDTCWKIQCVPLLETKKEIIESMDATSKRNMAIVYVKDMHVLGHDDEFKKKLENMIIGSE